MNFEKLLNYQKADVEYKNRKKAIINDPNHKKMRQAKEIFDDAKKKSSESEILAQSVMNAYTEALAFLEKNAEKVQKLCDLISAGNISDEEEANAIEQLNALKAEYVEWEKKANSLKTNADKAIADYTSAQKSGSVARDEYKKAKAEYEKATAGSEDELKSLEEARDKARKEVDDEKLLALYDSITTENKNINNVVVPLLGDEKSPMCGGCGMAQSASAKDELASKGYIRCETCHRIIYKA